MTTPADAEAVRAAWEIPPLRPTSHSVEKLPERIRRRISVQPGPYGCWLWTGSTNRWGYGILRWERRRRRAHAVVYEILVGPIPAGLVPDHLCRTHNCANPDHLDPVTEKVNILRGMSPPAQAARSTTCRRGHSLANPRIRVDGSRCCRTCSRDMRRLRRGYPTPPRVSDETVAAVREARRLGASGSELAARFGVSERHAFRLARGESRAGVSA